MEQVAKLLISLCNIAGRLDYCVIAVAVGHNSLFLHPYPWIYHNLLPDSHLDTGSCICLPDFDAREICNLKKRLACIDLDSSQIKSQCQECKLFRL